MTRKCRQCRFSFTSLNPLRQLCRTCAARGRYLRVSKRFTSEEVIAFLAGRGFLAGEVDRGELRFDVALAVPGASLSRLVRIRHLSRGHRGGVDLVARGDSTGALRFIPCCYHSCQGCFKCTLAGELNGETPEEARERKKEYIGMGHKKWYLDGEGRKIRRNRLQTSCVVPVDGVYQQEEDID